MLENLYTFKKDLDKEGVIFCFSGIMSQDVLTSFMKTMERKLGNIDGISKANNIFAVFVEMVQNIMSYSSDSEYVTQTQKQSYGIMILGYDKELGKYFIKSGNKVCNDDAAKITERIDELKDLDKDELKALYKELRKSGKYSHERGGGLGFLEIQRKSTMPLKYRFEKIDEKYQFFCLKSLI